MNKNKAEAVQRFGVKTNYLNGRSKAFSIQRLSQDEDRPQTLRIYDVTRRADTWRIMDHARILLLKCELRRCRDRLAAIARIAKGGKTDD